MFMALSRVLTMVAHIIKNSSTGTAKALSAIQSTNRWAMSGTPVQNKLTDLASIVQFLRLYPFCDPRVFDAEIVKPWTLADKQGFLRLKALVNLFCICRNTSIVNLPKRFDEVHRLEFNRFESKLYELAKYRTASLLDNSIAGDYSQRPTYLNALQWLNDLRLICNHGVLHLNKQPSKSTIPSSGASGTWDAPTAQRAFENLLSAGAAICVGCSRDLAETQGETFEADDYSLQNPWLSECLFLLCGSCRLRSAGTMSTSSPCAHSPKCPTVDVSVPLIGDTIQPKDGLPVLNPHDVPTKIRALLSGLLECRDTEQR